MMLDKVYCQITPSLENELISKSKELQAQEAGGDIPPIFVRILAGKFKDWVISIENISFNKCPSFGYSVCMLPKIADEDIEQQSDQLNQLLCEILADILEHSYNNQPSS